MLPFERQQTLSAAYERMKDHVEGRNWVLDFTTHGEDVVTTGCALRTADGSLVAGGYGKGGAEISRVGALYEAVEHYFCRVENVDFKVVCVRAEQIHAAGRSAELPFASELLEQKDCRLACAFYEDFHTAADVLIPLFLVFPQYPARGRVEGDDFDYSVVSRYSSNSGTAIGASFEEAAIHALNEIIERDAWSLFLLSHFMNTQRKVGRAIDTATVPDELGRLLAIARHRASDRDIVLIDITSDIGVPTFVATVDRILAKEVIYPSGYGSSTNAFYAAYRAVTEFIQVIDLKKHYQQPLDADRATLGKLANYPRMRDCAYFQVDAARLERRPWTYQEQSVEDLGAVLSYILLRLQARGIDMCFNINYQAADAFCVVSCVSMTLERFFLVSAGHLMAPGARGMSLFERSRAEGTASTQQSMKTSELAM